MKYKHNKKRNVGLLNEFFVRLITSCILNNDDKLLNEAKKIYKKYFTKGTEIYNELVLAKALYETNISTKEAALLLLEKIKKMAKKLDTKKLEQEKTNLLFEINRKLDKQQEFFRQEIPDYTLLGAIQILLEHWKNEENEQDFETIKAITNLEDKIINHLTRTPEEDKTNLFLDLTEDDINNLVLKIMLDKMNEKYKDFNDDQKKILQLYVFCIGNNENKHELKKLMQRIKNSILYHIESENYPNDVKEKLMEVKTLLENEFSPDKVDNINNNMIAFYLSAAELENNLKKPE